MIPKHLQGKKHSKPEKEFIDIISSHYPHLINSLILSDDPYKGYGFDSDFVLMLPKHSQWLGICVEIQGGLRQGDNVQGGRRRKGPRTGHASYSGIIRDYQKCIACQLNNYFFYPIPSERHHLEICARFLDKMSMQGKLKSLYS